MRKKLIKTKKVGVQEFEEKIIKPNVEVNVKDMKEEKVDKNMYKRKEIRKTFGFINVKNPTKEQRFEIKKDVAEINERIMVKFTEEIEKSGVVMTKDIDRSIFKNLSERILESESENMDIMTNKYLKMLTDIPEEILDDKTIMDDPSKEVIDTTREIDKIIKEYSKDYRENFNELLNEQFDK